MSTAPTPHPRLPLNRERVLDAAVVLADEGGIESLTMRRLAQALGVEAMSLYNHVANKADIVDGIVELTVDEFELPTDADDWRTAVRTCAISAHEALLRHPWACSLVIAPTRSRAARAGRILYMEWLLGVLREAGFSPELASHAYHAVDSHILGFTLWQLGHLAGAEELAGEGEDLADVAATFLRELPGEFPYLAEHIQEHLRPSGVDRQSEFEFCLDLILDSLERARYSG